jgi:hypothetical protein
MNIPTTEQEVAELSMREAVLPPRVQRLRQKLSRKAKEQKRGFCLINSSTMTIDESWMQEICTSSLKRGRAILRQAGYAVFRHRRGNPDTRFAVTYTCTYPLSTLPADGTLDAERPPRSKEILAKPDIMRG